MKCTPDDRKCNDSDALFVWLYKYLNISVLRIFSLLHCE